MSLDQILAMIRDRHPDEDISALVTGMATGNLDARKQLADMVAMRPALLPPLVLLEVTRWGINDDMSQCREIRACVA